MGAKDFKETIFSLRRGKTGIRICPACGCADVSMLTPTGFLTQPIYICNKCGFQNILFFELTPEDKNDKKRDEQKNKEK